MFDFKIVISSNIEIFQLSFILYVFPISYLDFKSIIYTSSSYVSLSIAPVSNLSFNSTFSWSKYPLKSSFFNKFIFLSIKLWTLSADSLSPRSFKL